MMKKFLYENFLVYYYYLESVCADFITEEQRREIFYSLADIFCLDRDGELDAHYEQTRVDWVREIEDYTSYERICRILEFAEISGQDAELTELDRLTLMSKRIAMVEKDRAFNQSKTLTVNTVSDMLHKSASNGLIYAIGALSYMEYHGICVSECHGNAVRRIRPCARWNDIFGNLLGIKYDSRNRDGYYSRLYTVLTRVNMCSVFERICQYNGYTFKGDIDREANILCKAFAMNVVSKSVYDRNFAGMLFSEIIPIENKERMALNSQNDWNTVIPFYTESTERMSFDSTCVERVPLIREGESRSIARNLAFASVCPNSTCKPLLIVSGDEFISDMYAEMIKDGLGSSPVAVLDGVRLSAVDLSPSIENIFVRTLTDTKASGTVFIIKNCEGLKPEVMEGLVDLLDYGVRKRFKLLHSAITLDLSGIKFVLLADEGGWQVKALSSVCDTVRAVGVNAEEMDSAVKAMLSSKAAEVGVDGVTVSPECYGMLARHSISEIKDIADEIIKDLVLRQDNVVKAEDINNACRNKNISRGGQGFGFTWGV